LHTGNDQGHRERLAASAGKGERETSCRVNCIIKSVFADFVINSNLLFFWLGKLKVELKPDVDKLI
jgi:hypothetical protein